MRKNAKSFYNWCQENNKNYCDYWDYDLNDKTPMEVGYSIKDKYYFMCKNGHDSFLKGIKGNETIKIISLLLYSTQRFLNISWS